MTNERPSNTWLQKAETILNLVDEILEGINNRSNRQNLSSKYRTLKTDVQSEARRVEKKNNKTEVNGIERDYSIMIRKIDAYLTVPVNCNPFAGELRDNLVYIRVDVNYFIFDYKDE